MNLVLAVATVLATVVLLGGLQWLSVLLRELPAERRSRRAARTAAGWSPTNLPELRQLERLAEEALAGDRLAVARLAALGASAARRSGRPSGQVDAAGAAAVTSSAGLRAALDRWEAAGQGTADARSGPSAADAARD